jgi:hypothetical protein
MVVSMAVQRVSNSVVKKVETWVDWSVVWSVDEKVYWMADCLDERASR